MAETSALARLNDLNGLYVNYLSAQLSGDPRSVSNSFDALRNALNPSFCGTCPTVTIQTMLRNFDLSTGPTGLMLTYTFDWAAVSGAISKLIDWAAPAYPVISVVVGIASYINSDNQMKAINSKLDHISRKLDRLSAMLESFIRDLPEEIQGIVDAGFAKALWLQIKAKMTAFSLLEAKFKANSITPEYFREMIVRDQHEFRQLVIQATGYHQLAEILPAAMSYEAYVSKKYLTAEDIREAMAFYATSVFSGDMTILLNSRILHSSQIIKNCVDILRAGNRSPVPAGTPVWGGGIASQALSVFIGVLGT